MVIFHGRSLEAYDFIAQSLQYCPEAWKLFVSVAFGYDGLLDSRAVLSSGCKKVHSREPQNTSGPGTMLKDDNQRAVELNFLNEDAVALPDVMSVVEVLAVDTRTVWRYIIERPTRDDVNFVAAADDYTASVAYYLDQYLHIEEIEQTRSSTNDPGKRQYVYSAQRPFYFVKNHFHQQRPTHEASFSSLRNTTPPTPGYLAITTINNTSTAHSSNFCPESPAASVKSHKSVRVLGVHPLGSLHVHIVDEGPIAVDNNDEGPPPLDPLAGPDYGVGAAHRKLSQDMASWPLSSPSLEPLRHDEGGGDVVLILDLPQVFTIGYDSISFTAKHFGGIRDIPPGPHFFWVAHPGGLSTRSGFWIVTTGVDTVHVMQWVKCNEVLGEPARAEARIQAENLDAIHAKLVPYRDPSAVNANKGYLSDAASERNLKMWGQLTDNITEGVLTRITGQQLGNWTVNTGDRVRGSILMAGERELDNTISNPLLKSSELNFTLSQISRTYSTDHTGADRTLEAMDSTSYIISLIDDTKTDFTGEDILGELQYAFIVGMHLGNDSCIQQWWYMLLKLILKAYLLPAPRPGLTARSSTMPTRRRTI
ncbi:hypothetical protein G7046_g6571 [Stylonectria norvegica]|nr:hypothetical protein G7046_g6571 [Stylonectria norvegica]